MVFQSHPQARPDVETYVLPDGSCLLFDPLTCEGHALDILGALVWDYCDGTLTQDEIAREIADLLPQDPQVQETVTWILGELAQHGLLQSTPGAADAESPASSAVSQG